MTFRMQGRDGQDDVKQKLFEGTLYVDFVTVIVQSYFDILMRYVFVVTFCRAAVLKVMDRITPVKGG